MTFNEQELKVIFYYERGLDIVDIHERTGMSVVKISTLVTQYLSLDNEALDAVMLLVNQKFYEDEIDVYDTF